MAEPLTDCLNYSSPNSCPFPLVFFASQTYVVLVSFPAFKYFIGWTYDAADEETFCTKIMLLVNENESD